MKLKNEHSFNTKQYLHECYTNCTYKMTQSHFYVYCC